ncbi:unnamed protein product [Ambrosiozyma monospora]|uniref:Unnamed protein product n=1 Tax=Ambrosiozyma monospora TaxID=43982 RepID=A0A9W6YUU7_AMBMO|nr:unnamed protein product [Ambrosiozyma monospora]
MTNELLRLNEVLQDKLKKHISLFDDIKVSASGASFVFLEPRYQQRKKPLNSKIDSEGEDISPSVSNFLYDYVQSEIDQFISQNLQRIVRRQ